VVQTRGIRILICAAASLWVAAAFGQRTGVGNPSPPASGGTTPGGNPGGRAPGPGTTPPPDLGTQPNTTSNPYPNRPIYVSGRVVMDDGSELPQNITIERICGASPRAEGHTDSKGYFNVQLGAPNIDAFQDVSDGDSGFGGFRGINQTGAGQYGGGPNPLALANCELRARVAGYMSQAIQLYGRQPMDNPDIGTILLHRIAPSEGSTVSATTLAAPKNARKALQKGLDLQKKKKFDQAAASFQQAVEIDPKFAEAWFDLGRAQAAQGQTESARRSFDQSIAADPKFVPPYIEISMIEFQGQRWQELADMTEKAVKLDSFTYPQAFFMNAVANYNLHHEDVAEQSARRAQKLDTQHRMPQVSHLLGVILADRRDYTGAAAQMREYLKFAPDASDAPAVRSQLETLERQSAVTAQQQP